MVLGRCLISVYCGPLGVTGLMVLVWWYVGFIAGQLGGL